MLGQSLQQHQRKSQSIDRDKVMRGIAPNALVSLDSGNDTQCTTSSNSNTTTPQGPSRTRPLRATMRPRGLLPPPTASTLMSVSGSSNANTASTSSLHRPSRRNSLSSQASAFSESSQQEKNNGFTRCGARSVERGRLSDGRKGIRNVRGGVQGEEMEGSSCSSQQLPFSSSRQPPSSRKTRDLKQQDQENLHIISAKRTVHGEKSPEAVVEHLPLQDSSNKQHWQQQASHHAGSVSSVNSGKTLATIERKRSSSLALVPPLNASRLNPMQQETRSALVRDTSTIFSTNSCCTSCKCHYNSS